MRQAIFDALFKRMARDVDTVLVVADMGIQLVERFEEAYPDRFVNVGISEQHLIGCATGLWNAGYKPVCYTCSQFYLRAFEQIRLEIGLNGAPLILLGTTEGYDNAPLGPTHHCLEDWGALKAIPNLDIYCPSSKAYAATLLDRLLAEGRPAYVRIPKGEGCWEIDAEDVDYRPGRDTLFVTYGGTLPADCMELARRDSRAGTMIVNKLRPFRSPAPLSSYRNIIVVEDQFAYVGLYADICQLDTGTARVTSLAPKGYDLTVGTSPAVFHERYGMNVSRFLPTGVFAKTDA